MGWDTDKLKDNVDVLEAYQESLSDKLNISHVNQSKEEVAHHWDHIKSAINKAATETVGTMKKAHKTIGMIMNAAIYAIYIAAFIIYKK